MSGKGINSIVSDLGDDEEQEVKGVRTLPIIEPVNYTMNVEVKKTRKRNPVELVIVEEDIVDYVTGYVSFENSFPKDLDFTFWDVNTHLHRVHQSLFKYFSNKNKKAVIVKSPVTKKTCNMCLDEKEYTQYDNSLRCSQCNDGFICHDCVYVYCGNLPIYKTDDWCNDFKINCPVCRKVHYVSI